MNECNITLYGILDPGRSRGRPLAELAGAAIAGGVTILQYRDKNASIREMITQANEIRQAIAGSNVPLLINDRVDVALATNADGVHLGQNDMAPSDARRILGPNAIIGQTIKTIDHAKAAPVGLLEYVCIGGVFETLSKDNPVSIGLDGWQGIASHFRTNAPSLPVGAIAGIGTENIEAMICAGADGVAIISALFMADDVENAAGSLRAQIENARNAK